jgi:hypothetical protein
MRTRRSYYSRSFGTRLGRQIRGTVRTVITQSNGDYGQRDAQESGGLRTVGCPQAAWPGRGVRKRQAVFVLDGASQTKD